MNRDRSVVSCPPAWMAVPLLSLTALAAQSQVPPLSNLHALVYNAAAARAKLAADPLGYGYDLFFFVNWPALGARRGQPDPRKKFGDMTTTVWESWKNSAEVYQPCGNRPASWDSAEAVPPAVKSRPQQPSDSGTWWQNMTSNVQANGLAQPDLQKNDLLYEIRMNEKTFGYILQNTLFNIDGQVAFAAKSGDLNFAFDALEVKSSWHWIDPSVTTEGCRAQDYFTANAYYPQLDNNGKLTGYKTGLMGLTGLHIITKAVPQWAWITFEQKNNEKCIGVSRTTPIDPKVVAENADMAPLMAKSGKWANYMMIGVQASTGTADQPVLLANTQIESAFQARSSCVTCHQFANVATRFPVKPEDDLRKSYVDTSASPPYYIGPAPALGPPYKSMDFVWSLRRASRFQAAGCGQ